MSDTQIVLSCVFTFVFICFVIAKLLDKKEAKLYKDGKLKDGVNRDYNIFTINSEFNNLLIQENKFKN